MLVDDAVESSTFVSSGRRRLETPDFLLPIATAVASSVGVPVASVVLTVMSGQRLTVEVRPHHPASGGGGGSAALAAAASGGLTVTPPVISVAAITEAVNNPSFTTRLSTALVSAGLPYVDPALLVTTEAAIEATVVEAPSPPPPATPPLPPPPMAPAHTLLSSAASGQNAGLGGGGVASGNAAAGDIGSASDGGFILALVFASIAGVLFFIVLPLVCCIFGCWARAAYLQRKRLDAKVFTSVVNVEGAPPVRSFVDEESRRAFDAAPIPAIDGSSAGGALTSGLSVGALVTRAPPPTGGVVAGMPLGGINARLGACASSEGLESPQSQPRTPQPPPGAPPVRTAVGASPRRPVALTL